jgi:hypothetical protein
VNPTDPLTHVGSFPVRVSACHRDATAVCYVGAVATVTVLPPCTGVSVVAGSISASPLFLARQLEPSACLDAFAAIPGITNSANYDCGGYAIAVRTATGAVTSVIEEAPCPEGHFRFAPDLSTPVTTSTPMSFQFIVSLVSHPSAPTASVPFTAQVERCRPVIQSTGVPVPILSSIPWASQGQEINFRDTVDAFTQSPACGHPLTVSFTADITETVPIMEVQHEIGSTLSPGECMTGSPCDVRFEKCYLGQTHG